jgi:hypothetical protein
MNGGDEKRSVKGLHESAVVCRLIGDAAPILFATTASRSFVRSFGCRLIQFLERLAEGFAKAEASWRSQQ